MCSGTINLETRGPRKFVRGHIVSGRLFPPSFFSGADKLLWWGEGTSQNDVSPHKCSWTLGPQINRSLWHNVPGLLHPCHYSLNNTFRLVQNDRDVSLQGYCIFGTIDLGDQGSQNNHTGTHCFGMSRHPTHGTGPQDISLLFPTKYVSGI